MTWPIQKNGGRTFEEKRFTEINGVALPFNIGPGNQASALVEWGTKGYTRGLISISFGARAAAGTFKLEVKPFGSDGVELPGSKTWPFTPTLADGGPNGTAFAVSFFDGPLPGNWNLENAPGAQFSGGNEPNPIAFTNAAMLQFIITNLTGAALPLTAFNFLLSGDN